jgi:hypothetical protein
MCQLGSDNSTAYKTLTKQRNSGIINVGDTRMKIDITIDKITPCLVERTTGKIFNTQMISVKLAKNDYKGWNFDWSIPKRNGFDIHALKIINDDKLQGLIASKIESANKSVHVDIVESAPHNYGSNGQYEGVGGHLFAFACKRALDNDYNYIYFDAKTSLIKYYQEKLGAERIGRSNRMIIEGDSFLKLIKSYYGGALYE